MSCPLARAWHVLHSIDACENLIAWNPAVATRGAHAGVSSLVVARDPYALPGAMLGGQRRDRKKSKAARAARKKNRSRRNNRG